MTLSQAVLMGVTEVFIGFAWGHAFATSTARMKAAAEARAKRAAEGSMGSEEAPKA